MYGEAFDFKNECNCKIVDGLFRRGKDGCKKSIENHKF